MTDGRLPVRPLGHEASQALLREYGTLAAKHGPQSPQAIAIRNRLVEGHLGLIFIVRKMHASHVAHDDAIGIGSQGLIKAVERFDVSRGLRFSTYATWWTRHALCRTAANEFGTIRVPVHTQERNSKAKAECRDAAHAARRVRSLDVTLDPDSRETYAATIVDDDAARAFDAIDNTRQSAQLARALATLPAAHREVMSLRADGLTRAEVAARLGAARERVRRLEAEGLARMRRALRDAA